MWVERGSICYAKCVKAGLSLIVPHTFFLSIIHTFSMLARPRGCLWSVLPCCQAARAVPVWPKSPRVSALVERFSPPVTRQASVRQGAPVLAWRRERLTERNTLLTGDSRDTDQRNYIRAQHLTRRATTALAKHGTRGRRARQVHDHEATNDARRHVCLCHVIRYCRERSGNTAHAASATQSSTCAACMW